MAKSFDVETTVLEKSMAGKKLKIKILTKKPANEVGHISEHVADVHCTERMSGYRMPRNAANQLECCDGGKFPVNGRSRLSKDFSDKSFLNNNPVKNTHDNESHRTITGLKRDSEESLDSQERKRLKMDCIAASRCQSILQKLMKHKFAKPFLEPVKPADWGIHDYFDIIKHPMDLGTVKQKLHRNTYTSAEEFEADVRLTFSNAMLYNPSNNWVHQHAKRLSEVFDGDWKSIKAILTRDQKNILKKRAESDAHKIASSVRVKCVDDKSSHVDPMPVNMMSRKENGCENLKMTSLEEPDLLAVKDLEAKPFKQLRSNPNCDASVYRWDKESARHMSTKAPYRNTNGDKVPDEVNAVEVKNTSIVHKTRSDPDSDGAVSCLDEEHAFASIPTTTGSFGSATTQSLETVLDMELSPSKALRAAKLRSRFADTILKAQNKTLLQPVRGGKNDAVVLEQEKERLMRKQREERARIEAQVREAELAARLKAEGEQKKQRQQARDAARAALEKMERSINLDDNFHLIRDLEALLGTPSLVASHDSRRRSRHVCNQIGNRELSSPLERLGLYIKAEYRIGDDDDDEVLLPETDLEEGEVPT